MILMQYSEVIFYLIPKHGDVNLTIDILITRLHFRQNELEIHSIIKNALHIRNIVLLKNRTLRKSESKVIIVREIRIEKFLLPIHHTCLISFFK